MRHATTRVPDAGDLAPDFALAAGGTVRLSGLWGAPVVLAFPGVRWNLARSAYVAAYNAVVADLPGHAGARLLSIEDHGAPGAVAWRELAFADAAVTIPVIAAESTP